MTLKRLEKKEEKTVLYSWVEFASKILLGLFGLWIIFVTIFIFFSL